MNHWTQDSVSDFVYSISLDFFTQLEDRIQESGMQRKEVADKLSVTPSAVSQMLNSPPEKPELETLVKYARGLGLKVSVVLYNDDDPNNERGPVYSGIFEKSWEALKHPRDLEAVNEAMSHMLLPRFDWLSTPHHGHDVGNLGQPVRGVNHSGTAVRYWEKKPSSTPVLINGASNFTQDYRQLQKFKETA